MQIESSPTWNGSGGRNEANPLQRRDLPHHYQAATGTDEALNAHFQADQTALGLEAVMLLCVYCILLTAHQGDPSAFLYLMSIAEWLWEVWMMVGWLMGHANNGL